METTRLNKLSSFFSILISFAGCGTSNSASSTDSCGKVTSEQTGVKICSLVATPTASESITLKNYDSSTVTLTGYTLWDQNALSSGSGQKTLTSSDTIAANSTLTITTGGSPCVINDSGETITLKNASGTTLDSKSN